MGEPTNEEIADVLERACDELIVRGWFQGEIINGAGNVCALGAIVAAEGGPLTCDEAYDAAWQSLAALAFGRAAAKAMDRSPKSDFAAINCVWSWNDSMQRTEDDVHDLLRSTAKALREQG